MVKEKQATPTTKGSKGQKPLPQQQSQRKQQEPETTEPPSWPPFKPALPLAPLAFEHLIPNQVVVARNFFPRSLCRDYVSFLRTLPLVTTPARPKRGEAVRQNDRFQIQDPAFAARIWETTGLREAVVKGQDPSLWGGDVLGLSPNIRVYRYSKGQLFAPHYDDSNNLTFNPTAAAVGEDNNSKTIQAKTTWTLLLYLTSAADGCVGGETVFHPHDRVSAKEEIAVAPETGLLLLHKHGDDCMLHEGREVTGGEKWVLRSDLCVRRYTT